MSLSVVVLAAGRGVRMRSSLPKVLHSVAGVPMLTRILSTISQLNPQETIVVCNSEQKEQFEFAVPVLTSVTWALQNEALGTGHAVLQALPYAKEDRVLILYGDISLIRLETLQRLLSNTDPKGVGLVSMKVENPYGLGRLLRNEAGKLLRIVEEKEASEAEKKITEINAGFFVAPKECLEKWLLDLTEIKQQKEYYLPDIVDKAQTEGFQINTVSAEFEWEVMGVNDKAQLAQLERCFQVAQAKQLMDQGVRLLDPNRFDLRGEVTVGKDVVIDVNVILEGKVVLGDNVHIGPNVCLKNTTVQTGAYILANSLVEGATIGADCRIGPFARIRPGTVLLEKVRVGNFVEIKNTTIHPHSKANHLSYLGDATIGAKVNIGAGTITCNFDGKSKHKTVIEEGVFIGSGTQLVAPVTVGVGSTVGSGTIVTRDVPPNHLIHNSVKHRVVSNWVKEEKE